MKETYLLSSLSSLCMAWLENKVNSFWNESPPSLGKSKLVYTFSKSNTRTLLVILKIRWLKEASIGIIRMGIQNLISRLITLLGFSIFERTEDKSCLLGFFYKHTSYKTLTKSIRLIDSLVLSWSGWLE